MPPPSLLVVAHHHRFVINRKTSFARAREDAAADAAGIPPDLPK
jgi:hypothetical protein